MLHYIIHQSFHTLFKQFVVIFIVDYVLVLVISRVHNTYRYYVLLVICKRLCIVHVFISITTEDLLARWPFRKMPLNNFNFYLHTLHDALKGIYGKLHIFWFIGKNKIKLGILVSGTMTVYSEEEAVQSCQYK